MKNERARRDAAMCILSNFLASGYGDLAYAWNASGVVLDIAHALPYWMSAYELEQAVKAALTVSSLIGWEQFGALVRDKQPFNGSSFGLVEKGFYIADYIRKSNPKRGNKRASINM